MEDKDVPSPPGRPSASLPPLRQEKPVAGGPRPLQLRESTAQHLAALADDQPPQSYLERLAHQQVARHAAALDLAHQLEGALFGGLPAHSPAAAIAKLQAPALIAVLSYAAVHERGLERSVKLSRSLAASGTGIPPPKVFRTEPECWNHLRQWQEAQPWQCPQCQGTERWFLRERPVFECCCGQQYSLTYGTIFHNSRLSLVVWFNVIAYQLCGADRGAHQIAREVGLQRTQTVRTLLDKISSALASPQCESLLAGVKGLIDEHLNQALLQSEFESPPPAGEPDANP